MSEAPELEEIEITFSISSDLAKRVMELIRVMGGKRIRINGEFIRHKGRVFTTREAAAYLGIPKGTLHGWIYHDRTKDGRKPPPRFKDGHRYYYYESDLQDWRDGIDVG